MTTKRDAVLRFDLPFCIHLKNDTYQVILGKRRFRIQTQKAWRNSKDCSDDDSVGAEKSLFQEASYEMGPMGQTFEEAKAFVGTNIERIDDPHGRFRYTKAAVWLEHPNPDKADAAKLLPEALSAVNRLVDVYRFVSDSPYLPHVGVEDIDYAEVFVPDSGRVLYATLFGKGIQNAVINESGAVHERVMEMLATGEDVPLGDELRLATRRLLGEGLWRQAVVEAVSSLDVFLAATFQGERVEQGTMAEDQFEDLMSKPITHRMKEPLRDTLGCSPVDRPSLWRDWIQSNKTRRKVVHAGAQITEKEATKVVETIEALVAYMREHGAAEKGL
jgi:hypothetical protein